MIKVSNLIFIIFGLLGFFLICCSFILAALNRKRYDEICILYKEKHGSLPEAITLFKGSDKNILNILYFNYGYAVKRQFIMMPILSNKNSIHMPDVDKEFIRGLPKRLIRPFLIEHYLAIIGAIFIVTGWAIMEVIQYFN
ncbi:hypothetical protein ABR157_004100 [Enterobacter soli]|jgi:hypothetical protein|uniref:hypothetical protein n=2 Tax=Enterobacter soli TaxID=885040 RepID=UPI0028A1A693|nr:hypothetical protein [Enterobacter soli]